MWFHSYPNLRTFFWIKGDASFATTLVLQSSIRAGALSWAFRLNRFQSGLHDNELCFQLRHLFV